MRNDRLKDNLKAREMTAFHAIPGMTELLQASPENQPKIQEQYPDAAFAFHVTNNLFNHDRELGLITQKAYFGILNGENIATVRFRYNKETSEYWDTHMWDN